MHIEKQQKRMENKVKGEKNHSRQRNKKEEEAHKRKGETKEKEQASGVFLSSLPSPPYYFCLLHVLLIVFLASFFLNLFFPIFSFSCLRAHTGPFSPSPHYRWQISPQLEQEQEQQQKRHGRHKDNPAAKKKNRRQRKTQISQQATK